jgi:hypothetical protein
MQPAPQVSPDGKHWWDGHSWQKLPTLADAPELDAARAAGPAHRGRVVGALVLWAVLVLGIGIAALGAIVLMDLLIPGHAAAGGAAPGVFLIAVGGLVCLPAVLQPGWFTRPAHPSSVDRSWMLWVLWAIVVLGFGTVALGMVVLIDLLIPYHPKTASAAPGVFLIGLGGLFCLGPTLRLLGFGLSISRGNHAPRPPKLIRPQTGSQRALTRLVIGIMVLLLVAVIVGTARQAGIGAALIADLATAVAFGIPAGIAWARQRGNQSQGPTPVVPPPPPTLTGSITVRPIPSYRWVAPLIFIAIGGLFLWNAVQNLRDLWFLAAMALVCIAIGVLSWSQYIQVDDSSITVGSSVFRRQYDRREVALIRASGSPWTNLTRFKRSDGSAVFSVSGVVWGQDRLQMIANHLGVPLEW